MRFLSVCIGTLLAVATASGAQAAETFLLHVPYINGDSKMAGHVGWIPVISFSGAITSAFDATSGRPTGRFMCQPLQILKQLDNSSPHLFMAVASAQVAKIELEAFITTTAGMEMQFLHLTLTNGVVSAVTLGGDATNSARTETITLNFEKIEVQYTPLHGEPAGIQDAVVLCATGG